jgi:hypothetical protein
VRVRDNDVSHGAALSVGQRDADAAGVNRDFVVDQKTG